MYGGTAEATRKYTHKPVVANNQTAAEMNIYLVNDQYTRCNVAGCSGVGGTTLNIALYNPIQIGN